MTKTDQKQSTRADSSVTGRDGYIVAQALFQACQWQEQLKASGSPLYEWSNHQDMKAILTEHYIHFAAIFSMQAVKHKQIVPDLEDEKRADEQAEKLGIDRAS